MRFVLTISFPALGRVLWLLGDSPGQLVAALFAAYVPSDLSGRD